MLRIFLLSIRDERLAFYSCVPKNLRRCFIIRCQRRRQRKQWWSAEEGDHNSKLYSSLCRRSGDGLGHAPLAARQRRRSVVNTSN